MINENDNEVEEYSEDEYDINWLGTEEDLLRYL